MENSRAVKWLGLCTSTAGGKISQTLKRKVRETFLVIGTVHVEHRAEVGALSRPVVQRELGPTRPPQQRCAERIRQETDRARQGGCLNYSLRKECLEEREPTDLCICPGWTEVTSPGDGWRGGGGGPVRAGEGDGVYVRSIDLEPTPATQRRSPVGLQGLDWFCVPPLQKESCL